MPQATNLVLKDSTSTDRTFKLLAPAAGFGSVASWAYQANGAPNLYPRITNMVRAGQGSGGTRLQTTVNQSKIRVPFGYLDENGVPYVTAFMEANISVTIPDSVPDASLGDFTAFLKNYVASALFQATLTDRAPAT